jgi:hypothetical protein
MEDIIRAIELEINKKERELSALRQSLDTLREPGRRSFSAASTDLVSATQFRGQGVGSAVRQYMETKKIARKEEIVDALNRGGIAWGKYPKRQVALAVANSPTVYRVEGDTVTLIPGS